MGCLFLLLRNSHNNSMWLDVIVLDSTLPARQLRVILCFILSAPLESGRNCSVNELFVTRGKYRVVVLPWKQAGRALSKDEK